MGIALPGCAQRYPIDRVVEIASKEEVPSYLFMPIDLPETAAAGQLVSALASRGELHTPVLMKVQQVQVRNGHYTAVLLDTGDAKRVVLLRPCRERTALQVGITKSAGRPEPPLSSR
jgi:hypothetical protein